MRKLLLFLALVFPLIVTGQTNNCGFTPPTITSNTPTAGVPNKVALPNGTPCVAFVMTYQTSGATGVSVQIEGAAADASGNPTGAWTALTAVTGSANPATGTASGSVIVCCDYYPWLRINPTTFNGTNQKMYVRVYGYVNTSAVKSGGGGGAPSGPAGGDLGGTYPNPTVLHLSHVTDGSLGNSGLANPSITINTVICTLGGPCTVTAAPSGAAGGDLSGSYPNPTVAAIDGTTIPVNSAADQVPLTTAPAAAAWKSLPNCTDTGGNHLNYATASHAFSCGTSGGGGSGALILVEQHPSTSGTEVDFTACISSTYDEYEIHLVGVLSNGTSPWIELQFSTDGGATYVNSGYIWRGGYCATGGSCMGASGSNSDEGVKWTNNQAGLQSHPFGGVIRLFDPLNGSTYVETTLQMVLSGYIDGNGGIGSYYGAGQSGATTAVNAFRIVNVSGGNRGTFTAGNIRCYGVAH